MAKAVLKCVHYNKNMDTGNKITVTRDNDKGLIEGKITHCRWSATVQPETTDCCITPHTLIIGKGRVSQLHIYAGNNKDAVAEFSKKWIRLQYNYIDMVEDLVDYLERRYSLKVVAGLGVKE
jgi:hypothetical protein